MGEFEERTIAASRLAFHRAQDDPTYKAFKSTHPNAQMSLDDLARIAYPYFQQAWKDILYAEGKGMDLKELSGIFARPLPMGGSLQMPETKGSRVMGWWNANVAGAAAPTMNHNIYRNTLQEESQKAAQARPGSLAVH